MKKFLNKLIGGIIYGVIGLGAVLFGLLVMFVSTWYIWLAIFIAWAIFI